MLIAVVFLALSLGFFRIALVTETVGLCYVGLLFLGTSIGTMFNRAKEWTAAMALIGIGLFLVMVLVSLVIL